MPQNLNRTRTLVAIAALLLVAGTTLLLLLVLHSSSTGNTTTRSVATLPGPSEPIHTRRSYRLTNAKTAHWAVVLRPVRAFSEPSATARLTTTLPAMTGDGTQNIVLVLGAVVTDSHRLWYEVRLAILPNNSIAWVPQGALGTLYSVDTHLYVDLASTTATLKRKGITVFTTTIGVGRSASPTPRGQFYVRDKLNGFHDPFYGPVAFGTSARSAVLTDWPGGGYIGVHGTDEPRILPGRVSHGCIRMRNASILTLARLMPVGTPVTIS
jgi:L,D-transpeptidase catalytic domain